MNVKTTVNIIMIVLRFKPEVSKLCAAAPRGVASVDQESRGTKEK